MTLKPLADRVLVKNDAAETKTASGLFIPEAAQEKTQTATVVSVGPGTDDVKITVIALVPDLLRTADLPGDILREDAGMSSLMLQMRATKRRTRQPEQQNS